MEFSTGYFFLILPVTLACCLLIEISDRLAVYFVKKRYGPKEYLKFTWKKPAAFILRSRYDLKSAYWRNLNWTYLLSELNLSLSHDRAFYNRIKFFEVLQLISYYVMSLGVVCWMVVVFGICYSRLIGFPFVISVFLAFGVFYLFFLFKKREHKRSFKAILSMLSEKERNNYLDSYRKNIYAHYAILKEVGEKLPSDSKVLIKINLYWKQKSDLDLYNKIIGYIGFGFLALIVIVLP